MIFNYCPNLHLPAEPVQSLSVSFLKQGEGVIFACVYRWQSWRYFKPCAWVQTTRSMEPCREFHRHSMNDLVLSSPRSCWWAILLLLASHLCVYSWAVWHYSSSVSHPIRNASRQHALLLLPRKWQLFCVASGGDSQHPYHLWSMALAPLSSVSLTSVSVGSPHTLSSAVLGGNRLGFDASWLAE